MSFLLKDNKQRYFYQIFNVSVGNILSRNFSAKYNTKMASYFITILCNESYLKCNYCKLNYNQMKFENKLNKAGLTVEI